MGLLSVPAKLQATHFLSTSEELPFQAVCLISQLHIPTNISNT